MLAALWLFFGTQDDTSFDVSPVDPPITNEVSLPTSFMTSRLGRPVFSAVRGRPGSPPLLRRSPEPIVAYRFVLRHLRRGCGV